MEIELGRQLFVISNFIRFRPTVLELKHADRLADKQKIIFSVPSKEMQDEES
jgi:hypothetical protein